jgi:hypothetical protein
MKSQGDEGDATEKLASTRKAGLLKKKKGRQPKGKGKGKAGGKRGTKSATSGRTGGLLSVSRSKRHLGWSGSKDSVPSIPTGFRNKARGCVVFDATPGSRTPHVLYPNGVVSPHRQPHAPDTTPLG